MTRDAEVVRMATRAERRIGACDPFVTLKKIERVIGPLHPCLLYTSDAADERSSVDLGGRRIIKKKKTETHRKTH